MLIFGGVNGTKNCGTASQRLIERNVQETKREIRAALKKIRPGGPSSAGLVGQRWGMGIWGLKVLDLW